MVQFQPRYIYRNSRGGRGGFVLQLMNEDLFHRRRNAIIEDTLQTKAYGQEIFGNAGSIINSLDFMMDWMQERACVTSQEGCTPDAVAIHPVFVWWGETTLPLQSDPTRWVGGRLAHKWELGLALRFNPAKVFSTKQSSLLFSS